MDRCSNAEILLAVVDYWSKPMIAQLPVGWSMLGPVLMPVLRNLLGNIPDGSVPGAAKALVDNAVKQGGLTLGNVRITVDDFVSLQRLLELNLPSEEVKGSGYCVITE